MYYVYALYNFLNNKIYIGQTEDLVERLRAHNEKRFKNSFTARYSGEWKVIYQESKTDRASALEREKQLKSYRGRQFLKNLIDPR